MDENKIKTLDKLIFPAGGKYLWGALSGQGNRHRRQRVMVALHNGKMFTLAKCGYNALMDDLVKAFEATGDCPAAIEEDLIKKLTQFREGK